jgi:hypothetical protein
MPIKIKYLDIECDSEEAVAEICRIVAVSITEEAPPVQETEPLPAEPELPAIPARRVKRKQNYTPAPNV